MQRNANLLGGILNSVPQQSGQGGRVVSLRRCGGFLPEHDTGITSHLLLAAQLRTMMGRFAKNEKAAAATYKLSLWP